jgi:hypothetical protein
MWRRVFALAIVGAQTIGCGAELPHGGAASPSATPRIVKTRLEAVDFVPGDLDLVLRIDLARFAAELGPEVMGRLRASALGPGDDADPIAGWLAQALAHADVVWLALRQGESSGMDRVLVVEGKLPTYVLRSGQLAVAPSGVADVVALDRRGPLVRGGFARVLTYKNRLTAFASAVEMDPVMRALRSGRGESPLEPSAEGLASLDARALRLPPPYEASYPALARALRNVARARVVVSSGDRVLRLQGELVGKTPAGAELLEQLFVALRDEPAEAGDAALFAGAKIEREGTRITIAWDLPGWFVASFFDGAR